MSAAKNKKTLITLFTSLGPGVERWTESNAKAMTPECVWWMQGWPIVIGLEEMKYQILVLQELLGVDANPILEWRSIKVYDEGKTIYFERRGAFTNKLGCTITDWDISGIFEFNEEGKIYRVRDYFDNSGPYQKLKGILPDEQIAAINKKGRESHPLAEGSCSDPGFYKNMYLQLKANQTAGSEA